MSLFIIKQGDTAPTFDKQLRNELGEIVPVSNYQEVEFHMRDDNYNTVIDDDTTGNVVVDNETNGDVSYTWQSGDTDDIGSYEAEFVVTFEDGTKQSFPVLGDYQIEIVEDIA